MHTVILKSKLAHSALGALIVIIFGLSLIIVNANAFAKKPHHRRVTPYAGPHPGRVVSRLPAAYVSVWVGGAKFFFHGGVFYRRGPGGFIVVQAPIGAIVVGLPTGYATIVINGTTYYYFNGVYYQKIPSGYIIVNAPIATQPSAQSGSQVTVTAPLLNVRSGPGMQFAVIRQTRQGDTLSVHGNSPGWLYVKLPDGNVGWVSETFTAPTAPPASG